MLSQFCIKRPIFATVMAILIVLAGIISVRVLPVSQYPNITPPSVMISASYDGADIQTLSRSTTRRRSAQAVKSVSTARSRSAQIRITPFSKSITASVRLRENCLRLCVTSVSR